MKIALYIEDGREQIVLTPDNQTERDILAKLHDGERDLSIKRGAFYACRGGWTRWKNQPAYSYQSSLSREDDESTMIVLDRKVPPTPEVTQ